MSARASVALGLLAACLAATLWAELRQGAAGATRVRLPAAPAGAARAVPGGLVPEGAVATILGRPLFERSRRPPALAVVAPAAVAGPPRLAGVMVSGGQRSAIFAVTGDRAVVVGQGGRVDGFLVQAIAMDGVTVLGPGGTQVLHLAFVAPGPRAASPAGGLVAPPAPAAPAPGGAMLSVPGLRFSPTGMPILDAPGTPP